MAKFEQKERQALYGLFTLDEHEIREGATSKDKKKIQWFTYIRREAIIERLDNHFFGEWESGFINNQNPYQYHQNHVDCAMHLTIRGIRREYNGSQDGGGLNGAKGAATDAFKRVASQWGIGLYLQQSPQIWTENYKDESGKIDWKKKDRVQAEALQKVSNWLKSLGAAGNALRVDDTDNDDDSTTGSGSQSKTIEPDFTPPNASGSNIAETDNGERWQVPTGDSDNEAWLPKIFTLTEFLYDGVKKHQENSINKLIRDKSITSDMKPIVAACHVFAYKAYEKLRLNQDDITDQLGKSLGEYLRSGKTLQDAWVDIQPPTDGSGYSLPPTGTDDIPF